MPQAGLTVKMKKFIERFVETGNKTQSYKDVYDVEMMTDQACLIEAGKILKREGATEYLNEVRAQYLARIGDKAEMIMKELVDDITYRDEKGRHSPTWQKSADLLQKQLGLQSQKIDANVSAPSIKIIIDGDEDDGKN